MCEEESRSEFRPEEEQMLCPNCLASNHPGADFCRTCGAPLGETAGMDPLKRIFTQGHLYRKAASGSRSPIVLLGMWLIFGPLVVGPLLSMRGTPVLSLLMILFIWPIFGTLLYRTTTGYFKAVESADEEE